MKTQLYIPKKINVGYQKRSDTYTGNLAYIIYWDDKGVLRKETSWQSWRDTSIDNTEIENVPTEGFVLNKGVGGQRHSYGWNARNEYIRVYDPRGFEFEISVANLLFILQECTSTKGKGLEGEFVYSWEGKELVLLPVSSQEYIKSSNFTALQGKKVTRTDMVPGCTYTCKKGQELVYIGRFPYYKMEYGSHRNDYAYTLKNKKTHVFLNTNYDPSDEYSYESKYIVHTGFTKLAVRNTETPVDNYAQLLEDYHNSVVGSEPLKFTFTPKDIDLSKVSRWGSDCEFFVGTENNIKLCTIEEEIKYGRYDYKTGKTSENESLGFKARVTYTYYFDENGILIREYGNRDNKYDLPSEYRGLFSKEELLKLKFNDCEVELEGGAKVKIKDY